MNDQIFILKDEEYQNGLFPQIPKYNKKGSWFLLTEGSGDDIIVDDRTTVKQIRQGRYKRLVEISKSPYSYDYTFDSFCKETSYTFKVTVRAIVSVANPVDFYSNIRSVNINNFFNNQFSLDVGKITRKYSILNYGGIDDELTEILTRTKVIDPTTGLSYQISTVVTQPNEDARKILKEKEDLEISSTMKAQAMSIRSQLTNQAGTFAKLSKDKTYEDAIWEEVAQGLFLDTEAIKKIDEYRRQSNSEKFNTLLKLRSEGFITDDDIALLKQDLLPTSSQSKVKSLTNDDSDISIIDKFYITEE